jgi:hypothetical protein
VTASAPAWFAPGFDLELTEWIDDALAARGEKRAGPLEEHRRWGIGLVAKVPTDAGQRWAKAVPDQFPVEGPLTAWLAARFPGDVPCVVAFDTDRAFAWHAWSYRRLLDGLLDEHRSDLGTIGAEWCEVFVNRSARLPPRAAPPVPPRAASS